MGVSYPYYGQQPPTAPFMQQPPPPPMVQTPVQQAAQQPQQGDIWSDLSTFSRTPQGQQALLAFANAAMQNSMNPQTGGGAGFINAVGSGMQGYKAADEYQERKARQKKTEDYEDLRRPLEIQHLKGEIAGQGAVATAHKLNETRETRTNGPDGRIWIQREVLTNISKDGRETWENQGKPYHASELPEPKDDKEKDPTAARFWRISKGLDPNGKWTQQESEAYRQDQWKSPWARDESISKSVAADPDFWMVGDPRYPGALQKIVAKHRAIYEELTRGTTGQPTPQQPGVKINPATKKPYTRAELEVIARGAR